MPGPGQRTWGTWIAAASACALTACMNGSPSSGPEEPALDPGSFSEQPVDPFPCTFTAGGGRSDGQCAAAWRAMDAGSVSNPVRIDVTMSGSSAGTPWSLHFSGVQNSPASDFPIWVTLDVALGAQAFHTPNLVMDEVHHAALTERWEAPGVALYLTAQSVETYPYYHFEMEDVHGTLDIAQPIEVHATF